MHCDYESLIRSQSDIDQLGEDLLARFSEQQRQLERRLEEATSTISEQLLQQLREDAENTLLATTEMIADEANAILNPPGAAAAARGSSSRSGDSGQSPMAQVMNSGSSGGGQEFETLQSPQDDL